MKIEYPEVFKTKFTSLYPVILFDFYRFKDIMMGDLNKVSEYFDVGKRHVHDVTGVSPLDVKIRVQNTYKNEFDIELAPKMFKDDIAQYALFITAYGGRLTLVEKEIPTYLETRSNFLSGVLVTLDNYHHGILRCSKCGAKIIFEEAIKHLNEDNLIFCKKCNEENIGEPIG